MSPPAWATEDQRSAPSEPAAGRQVATNLVELRQVSLRYGNVPALTDVSCALPRGTIGLVGNNGAGKSTLLKILLGLLRPTTGTGTILGADIGRPDRTLRGRIGYMSESAALVPLLKGVEYVSLSGSLYGMPSLDARRRAHELLNYVGLGELRYRRLEEYSTGNLQRLKLAAALVHDPELLLLDEPTNGLDPAGRRAFLALLIDLIAETGKSVILCSHLLGDVERLCQHVVVLDAGRVVHAGPLEDLRAQRSGRFVLTWQGSGDVLRQALVQRGIPWSPLEDLEKLLIQLPPGWSTWQVFELARAAGVTLTSLVPDDDSLERLFLRLTGAPADSAARHSNESSVGSTDARKQLATEGTEDTAKEVLGE